MTSQEFSKKYSRPGVKVYILPTPIENPKSYVIGVEIDGIDEVTAISFPQVFTEEKEILEYIESPGYPLELIISRTIQAIKDNYDKAGFQ